MYLNQIYFGHGAFGVEAAARTFFGKSVVRAERCPSAALLAGLPKAPSTYSPFEHPRGGQAPARDRAAPHGGRAARSSDAAGQDGRPSATLGLIPPERRRTTGQYFLEYVQQHARGAVRRRPRLQGRAAASTPRSRPTMQLKAEQALRDGLKALESRRVAAAKDRRRAGARATRRARSLTIEPQTGYIKAMVGGYDFFKSEFNRAVQARRQPGLGLQALRLHRRARVRASPRPAWSTTRRSSSRPAATARPGSPRTTTASSAGRSPTSRRSRSRSTWPRSRCRRRSASAARSTSPGGSASRARSARTSRLALGTSDLTLLEITSAYGALANQGTWMRPTAIRYVLDAQRQAARGEHPAGQAGGLARARLRDHPHAARARSSAAPARRPRRSGGPPRPRPARPTTTRTRGSSATRPQLATGVWVGYDRPRSLGKDETGSRVAVPIWTAFMQEALAGTAAGGLPDSRAGGAGAGGPGPGRRVRAAR